MTKTFTIGYLDCSSGVSGDMMLGALVDAGVPLDHLSHVLSKLPLSGYKLEAEKVMRCGLAATQVRVILTEHTHHEHRGLPAVIEIIRAGRLDTALEEKACAVFRNLAEAEARVHGCAAEEVHFHEVGAVDAICDIVAAVAGLEWLKLDELLFSTVSLGGGTARSGHGALPVPAPAVVELLRGLPVAGGPVDVELATPTGAALLKTLGKPSPQWPSMRIQRIGCGAGGRDIPRWPNVLRLAVGPAGAGTDTESDFVWSLEVNLDDMTGVEVAFLAEQLREAGALDVFVEPILMKKGRPAVKVNALCEPSALSGIEDALWRHSTTLGVRRSLWQRSKLRRTIETVKTPWGDVRVKLAFLGDEAIRCEPEYEDCRHISEEHRLPLRQVQQAARDACRARMGRVSPED
jgi:uncharacterized protein (TIGR00299 family) protein